MKTNDQHQIYEATRKRTKKRKNLYFHFVLFLIGSVFFIFLNKFLHIYDQYDWFLWAVMLWFFFLVIHFFNFFVFNRFFDKEWERIQTEKLIEKHNSKVEKLEKSLEKKDFFSKISSENDQITN